MTDELTPEEKAALESLPRERMPVGLEARVVGAMRDHGFLAKRRRTIAVTNGRMAGVLAAGVALMIGAYSIGLHRSDGGAMLPPATTLQRDERNPAETPTELPAAKQTVVGEAHEAESPARGADAGILEAEKRPEEKFQPRREDAPAPAQGTLSAQGKLNEPTDQAARPPAAASPTLSRRPLTFLLNGSPVVVDAPDSVRVTEDEQGRMLIIYTSDGIIRIRLADSP